MLNAHIVSVCLAMLRKSRENFSIMTFFMLRVRELTEVIEK
jgi:hypothetical protein